jgi:predicted nucleic acid-binding protein
MSLVGLVDTTVIVDLVRRFEPTKDWLRSQPPNTLGICPYVWMESVTGARTKFDQLYVLQTLEGFPLIKVTDDDITWAMRQLTLFRLSHNVGIMDCLIAAPCHRLQVPLLTGNVKHFKPLLNDLVVRPY